MPLIGWSIEIRTCGPQRRAGRHLNINNTALETLASKFSNNEALSHEVPSTAGCLRRMAVLGHSITATANNEILYR